MSSISNIKKKSLKLLLVIRSKAEIIGIKAALWSIPFIFTIAVFISRFCVSTLCGVNDIVKSLSFFVSCLALLYLSFIIEGIVLAISKIEDYDEEATISEMRNRHGKHDTLGPHLLKIKRKSSNILIGQPLLAIGITLLFNEAFKRSGLPPDKECFYIPSRLYFLYSSEFVSVIVSTMLIYWVAQILPQSLGKTSSVEFMRLSGALLVADGLAVLAKSGIGLPGNWIELAVERIGYKKRPLQLPLGNSKFLEAMITDYEKCVEKRTIIIEPKPDGIYITDTAVYSYSGRKREVDHAFKIARSQFDESKGIDLRLEFPENYLYEEIKTGRMYNYLYERDIINPANGTDESAKSGLLSDISWGEYIYTLQSSSDRDIIETRLVAKYMHKNKSFNMDRNQTDKLYFDLGVPTKCIEIIIRYPDSGFLFEPELHFRAEESRLFELFEPINRGICEKIQGVDRWTLIHTYPPLVAEMQLIIDARTATTKLPSP